MKMKPENLRVDPDRPTAFKSRLKGGIVRGIDALGGLCFAPSAKPVPWGTVRRIALLRLDHLGDVLLALPAIQALERALPHVQVDVFIGPWSKGILEIARVRAVSRVLAASWFTREGERGGTWRSLRNLEEALRAGRYDAAIELRGDYRHILAMAKAGIKVRAGLARTGFRFLLTHPLVYRPGLHETQRNLDLLVQAGIGVSSKDDFPRLYPREEDDRAQDGLREKLGIQREVIALHATCSAASKRWPASNWLRLIEGLPENYDLVLVGSAGEKAQMEEISKGLGRKVHVAAGTLNLTALAAFLRRCRLFIGVDSGPAHIAAAVGTPLVSLYSGTNRMEQWAPRGPRVSVLQKWTACSPCELTVCPIGNECMRQISPEEVLKSVRASIQ
jgi:ADP-heptose:LPS heptosyltransferase